MKLAPRFLSLLPLSLALPLACSTESTLPLDDPCAQVGFDSYEFEVLAGGFYAFEPNPETGARPEPSAESLLIDDDDLTDDYPIYLEGLRIYDEWLEANPGDRRWIDLYESIPAGTEKADYTAEQAEADAALEPLRTRLREVCWNYGGFYRNDRPELGVRPMFLSCKDKFDESGDGVIGWYDLARAGDDSKDAKMAACGSLSGGPNTTAVNAWGPVSTHPQGIPGPEVPYDGFTFSGLTIPLTIAPYQRTSDASEWTGVAFWARQATAEEGTPLGSADVVRKPAARKNVSADARPMDGVSQVGVIIQTVDTSALGEDAGARVRFFADSECTIDGEAQACFGAGEFEDFPGPVEVDDEGNEFKWGVTDEHGRPVDIPQPFCIDYSPVDSVPGEEAPFRQQCWDGFRTMLEVGPEWKFYFVPFDEMRQAGWGQVAPRFRTDQIRSVNFLMSAFQSTNVIFDEVAFYRRKD